MSEKCEYKNIKDYESAFECFKQRFLIGKKSIFRLDSDDPILDSDSISYLVKNFIENGYESIKEDKKINTFNVTANEKFFRQLMGEDYKQEGIEISDEVQKNAIEVLAHAVWLWRLPAHNTNTERRINSVKEVLTFNSEWKDKDLSENDFFIKNYSGFAMPGIGYNTNKANELAYIIKFFEQWLKDNTDDNVIINNLKKQRDVEIKTTHEYYKDGNEYKLKEVSKKNQKEEKSKVSVPNALLHLMDSDSYERIIGDNHKKKISEVFALFLDDIDIDIDEKIKIIKNKLGISDFYSETIKNIWLSEIDFESKNMILHGAPGTGKTYLTEESIKERKEIFGDVEYELVQFHPNYGYEDFIEGIKPIGLKDNQMQFELKNGIFKDMCIKAFIELARFNKLSEEKKKIEKLKKFYFIADEINRAELSRVFGELLLCLEDDKRLRFEGDNLKGTKIKLQNASLWQRHHAVVVLDDEDKLIEIDDNGNYITDGKMYFGIPENLYFIGTMNDIDRSVDSFDMALRRRFVWKKYRCDYDVVFNHFAENNDEERIITYIKICKKLNEHITSEKGFGLGNEFELGHSYFMKPKKLTQTQIDKVWIENIAPLLREYLRSIEESSKIDDKLKEAKEIFIIPKDKKKSNDTNS